MCTCFTRVVIILGLLRQAIVPKGCPGTSAHGLALFLSLYAMPTLERVWSDGVQPFVSDEQPDYRVAWTNCERPMCELCLPRSTPRVLERVVCVGYTEAWISRIRPSSLRRCPHFDVGAGLHAE